MLGIQQRPNQREIPSIQLHTSQPMAVVHGWQLLFVGPDRLRGRLWVREWRRTVDSVTPWTASSRSHDWCFFKKKKQTQPNRSCDVVFNRWRKGHSKKSPRSKPPAPVEHDRALKNMQRPHRRHQLPGAVSTFPRGPVPKSTLPPHSSLQHAQQFHTDYFIRALHDPAKQPYHEAPLTGEKTNIQKGERTQTSSPSTWMQEVGFELGTVQTLNPP